MKKHTTIYTLLFCMVFAFSCDQEILIPGPAEEQTPVDPCGTDPSAGMADFSKFVAIGSSFTAGFQAGALFDEGQAASVPAIMAKQFECVGGSTTFNQPSINSEHGFNIFVSPNPVEGTTVLGRFRLQGTPPKPAPMISAVTAIPNPSLNPPFLYTGDVDELNNFAVQAVQLGQALTPETGNWSLAGYDPRFNPFYARFASESGVTTMLTDMMSSLANEGTFFMLWLGMDDVMLNALYGGDDSMAPITNKDAFKIYYQTAIGAILSVNEDLKGVVGNFPDIFVMPHFTSVPYNAIPLDASTAGGLTATLAANYNAFLDAMVENEFIDEEEAAKRKVTFQAGQNPILMVDESLTDLTPYMAGPYEGLLPYAMARQTTSADIIPLSAGNILGTAVSEQEVWGVSLPVEDRYVLTPDEITAINTALSDFNTAVEEVAENNSERVAFADIHKAMKDFLTAKVYVLNNVTITPNINPPTGIYSEDGVHPNSRGYAFIAGTFIDAINTKFGSTIQKPSIAAYKATGLPINP